MSSFAYVLAFVAGLASGPPTPESPSRPSFVTPSWFFGNVRLGYEAPDVELWVSGDNLFRRGDRARVYFRTDEDAFVTIVRIDTDGRVDILFPEDPHDDAEVRGGHTYRVYGHGHESFVINDYPGLGYIFAIASWEPFDYDRVSAGRHWDYRYAGGRVHRDPYVAARDFAELLLVDSRAAYSFDVVEYHVERRVNYPRFLCYDCHAYRPYPVWDPYSHACVKFRIVIWDDPYYYPYRRYGGRRVVYVRERVREPRYEFKEVPRGTRPSDATLVEYRKRGSTTDQRRPGSPAEDPNVTSRRRADEGSSRGGSGATRPGDDIRSEPSSGRRRPTELDRDERATPTSPIRAPRRDPASEDGGDEGLGRGVRAPRRDEPSAEVNRSDRVDDRVIIEDRGRREPRVDDSRAEPERAEPRRESPRSEPRSEPRAEPRSEPRREAPPEPRREAPRSEPRAEPRRESSPPPKSEPRPSTPSNGGRRRTE
ncbi:MAG TPA: DUF4384 domain-containing protein [Gemmatimonadaceae bacterium]|nr:DUF4384 domain-containing protein [Gemmatimonadaceae bacterium]